MNKDNRLKVLEKCIGKPENVIEEITVNFVDMDMSITSTMKIKVNNHKAK